MKSKLDGLSSLFFGRSLAIITFAVVGLSGCASMMPKRDTGIVQPFIGSYQTSRFTLNNGLKIIVLEDHSSPTFAYQTWFRVGSRDELLNYTGLAHLFEHMMFKGTKTYPEGQFDRLLDQAGAEGQNAFTSHDYTAYVQELPKDQLDLIIKLESDRMTNLIVNDQSFSTEREVVQNERRYRNENSPDGLMYQELYELAYQQHSYRWPVIGYAEDLARMSAEDARKFYTKYYAPNAATIVVVGDVNPVDIYERIRKAYGSIQNQAPANAVLAVEPLQKEPRRKTLKLNTQVDKLMMGYKIPAVTDADYPVFNIIQMILSGGKSARLHTSLVDTSIASSASAAALDAKETSIFLLTANLQKGRGAAQAETVIMRELERLGRQTISSTELERARNRALFEFYEGLGGNADLARYIGFYETVANNYQLGLDQIKRLETVTAADVRRIAAQYFKPSARTVITGVRK
jgi:zinc protease